MTTIEFSHFVEQLTQASSIEEVHGICTELTEYFGFDCFHYGAQLPTSFTKPTFIDVSGYPTDWWEHYKDKAYICSDPIVKYCASNIMPLVWDKINLDKAVDNSAWHIMGEASDFGLKSGFSVPLHTPQGEAAMLSFASTRDYDHLNKHWAGIAPQASFLLLHLHEAMRRMVKESCLETDLAQLTNREKECLLWAADGKTTWETAQILNISERTVVFHVQNAAGKLNVANRQQAVARAISNGLISPQLVF